MLSQYSVPCSAKLFCRKNAFSNPRPYGFADGKNMKSDRADLLPVLLGRHLGVDQPVLQQDVDLPEYVGHSGDQLVHRERKKRNHNERERLAPLTSPSPVPTRTVIFSGRRALFCTLKMHRRAGRRRDERRAPAHLRVRARARRIHTRHDRLARPAAAAYDATASALACVPALVFSEK